MPNVIPRSSPLPEDVGMHVDELRKACPGIEQVWLLRHRTGERPEWELLAFADRRALEKLRAESAWRRADVRLLVVVDGDRFETAWGERSSGSLRGIDWRLDNAESASYVEDGKPAEAESERLTAVRVR